MPKLNRELDIENKTDLALIVRGVESSDNKQRKRHAWKAHNCLNENQKVYVQERIVQIYPKTHDKFRIGDILLVKKIITKKNKSYREDPKREAGSPTETENYENINEKGNFLEAWKELDKIVLLHKYAVLWVKHINPEDDPKESNKDAKYQLQALGPYDFDLVRDEVTGDPLLFILTYNDRDITFDTRFADGIEQVTSESQADTVVETRFYSIWSKDKFVRIKATTTSTKEGETLEIEIMEDKKNPSNLNDAGVLPIVYVQKSSSVDYPLPSNISDQSIEWNVGFSDYKTASAAQGHGILLYKYPDGLKDKKVTLHTGMHTAIDLPQGKKKGDPGSDAEYINASPLLSEQLDGLKFEAINILDDHGIKGSEGLNQSGSTQEFTSALDRIISNADVEDIIVDHQGCYIKAEQNLFSVIRSHENAKSSGKFSEDTVLNVIFPKPKVQISDSDTLKNIKERQDQGLDFAWEKHIRIDPNLTEKKAKERELLIQKEKAAQMKLDMQNASNIMDEENDDDLEKKKKEIEQR